MELRGKPLLSVIVPVYNGEAYVHTLVSCIAAQQMQDMELILVDDGSCDRTLERCRELQMQYEWMRIIHTENRGVSHARNTGLSLARGRWIHFMDVDDELEEGMYTEFERNAVSQLPDVLICGCCRIRMESGESAECGPLHTKTVDGAGVLDLFDGMKMESRYWILDYIWNKWYSKELIDTFQLRFCEDMSLGEDFMFNTRYFQHVNRISLISGRFYQYRIRESGLVSRFQKAPWEGRQRLYLAQVELFRSLGLYDTNRSNLQQQAGQIAFGDIRTINSRRCDYGIREKIRFVRDMINSSQYEWILKYLQVRKEKSVIFRCYEGLFRTRNAVLITAAICLEKIVQGTGSWKRGSSYGAEE